MARRPTKPHRSLLESDPLWFKDAVIYQVHVRTFQDSDDDGIGDFRGLASRLDYLQELGVTAIWLLPFYPSPLKDEGYDIADYRRVNPIYGDLRDFKAFLRQAHERGLRVITELVINHTSDQHPWFQRARRAKPGSRHRNYYVWSDTAQRYQDTRIIFQDFETSNWTWDPLAGAYFWHRFYHHQPDLNFESADVRREVLRALDFWLAMGVDGMRLDAIPYLFEREGTNCENLPETHAFLKELRAHVDARWENKMLLAEANQWPEDAVEYFGDGDECHMSFHFPVMPRLFMAVRMEDRFPILDILEQTPEIPEGCQWAIFLRNHDELTLEMVTDEDRDYMYRVYAAEPRARINLGIRRRLAPLLGNDRGRVELMNALLMSLPGTPIVYYGDEIGMGDNFYLGDRNGVRTPMQWSPDRNAGFSRANPHRLYLPVIIDPEYHYEAVNVETQQGNPHSLLWWMRRLVALRKRYRAFGRGSIEFLQPDNHRVLAFVRRHRSERGDEAILVVANLSRFVQHVELDLSEYEGVEPVELFGRTRFPGIGELPYLLTLGPHGFYWFSLGEEAGAAAAEPLPTLRAARRWQELVTGDAREELEAALPGILAARRWFGGKSRAVRGARVAAAAPIPDLPPDAAGGERAFLTLVEVEYFEEEPETYVLPLAFRPGEDGERMLREGAWDRWAALARVGARVELGGGSSGEEPAGVLVDALAEPAVCQALLGAIERRRSFPADGGTVSGWRGDRFRELRGPVRSTRKGVSDELPARVLAAEQSNTSIAFGDRLVLKVIRKLEPGRNPDLEIGRFLTEVARFEHTAPVAGALEYRTQGRDRWREGAALAVLQGFVANEGDAWRYTLDFLSRFFERVVARGDAALPTAVRRAAEAGPGHPLEVALAARRMSEEEALAEATTLAETESEVQEVVGLYPTQAALLGRRTAELPLSLASAGGDDPAFAPEAFGELYQRSLYQSMRASTGRTFRLLRRSLKRLPEELRPEAEELLGRRQALLGRFDGLRGGKIAALRTRTHGDYHLGQVLWTGKDFRVIDFEGEPARPLSERRIKRSPLRDVAGMLRSFDYAVHAALRELVERGIVAADQLDALGLWGRLWYQESAAAFLRAYLETAEGSRIVPADEDHLRLLLDAYLLDKAIYELRYELDNRPGWVGIALDGILAHLG
ncbi:MAG TPA: maltose alpha-D-glucosyltransferase [Thermoanaerobaculia bacterium]|nr:maltose alpha-D-glucosyltransferase [Thermoanaerobaculia bacterium]